jgi:hypothetical protein
VIKWLLHYFIRQFEAKYEYDASYLHTIANVPPRASMGLMKLSAMTRFQGSEPAVWGGAALSATLYSDCGPCAQLVLTMVQNAGLDRDQLRACVVGNWDAAGATGLAVLENTSEVTSLADQIVEQFGQQALVAAAFATTSYPVYPLLKRALGEAKGCEMLRFDDNSTVKVSNDNA